MALTIANTNPISEDVWGRARVRVVNVTFDSSYATGGESFTPASVGLSEFLAVLISPDSAAGAEGYTFQYDYTAETIQAYVEEAVAAGGPLVEAAAATNLSTAVVRVVCIGI